MKRLSAFAALAAAAAIFVAMKVAPVQDAHAAESESLQIATFTEDGEMIRPDNLDEWIFVGSSLGMGYSQADFNPDTPGNFQIVQMEPTAYREFLRTGEFPDGTMLALTFYFAERDVSINQAGFIMGGEQMVEIHLKDQEKFPRSGFNFFMFPPETKTAASLPASNDCIECHSRDGAYDAVFTQFYPLMRDRLAETGHAAKVKPGH